MMIVCHMHEFEKSKVSVTHKIYMPVRKAFNLFAFRK